jgi:glycosyltransferase involved in cell wall biosynthesis
MRIAHVTTFWPTSHFGHTHYTQNLIRGIQSHRPGQQLVLGEGDAAAAETAEWRCIPCWHRGQDYVDAVAGKLREVGADVAYLQYSPDLFGDDERFPRLCRRLAEAGVKTVANMHSVYPARWRSGYLPGRRIEHFDRAVAEHVGALQVHSQRMRRDFIERGIDPAKIVVIPHGSVAMERRDVAASRRKLGIPVEAKVVLFFGFIWPGKGLDGLITSFARAQRRVPGAFLYVGGHTRKTVLYTRAYMAYLQARLKLAGVGGASKLHGGFVPEEEVPSVYSAADVVAMPYRQDYSSVSGVVHQTAGIGKLMLCSRIAKFDEIRESVSEHLCVDPYDKRAWAEGLERLLTDQPFADKLRAQVVRFGEATSWPSVAAQHVALHERLAAGRAAA